MVHTRNFTYIAALLLLEVVPRAIGHGDRHGEWGSEVNLTKVHLNSSMDITTMPKQSYFALGKHNGLIFGHIALMIVAWFFVLPIGESRS